MCGVSIGLAVCKLLVTSRSIQTSNILTECHLRMMIAGLPIISIQIVLTLSRHDAFRSIRTSTASGQVDTAPVIQEDVMTPLLLVLLSIGYDVDKTPLRRLDIDDTATA